MRLGRNTPWIAVSLEARRVRSVGLLRSTIAPFSRPQPPTSSNPWGRIPHPLAASLTLSPSKRAVDRHGRVTARAATGSPCREIARPEPVERRLRAIHGLWIGGDLPRIEKPSRHIRERYLMGLRPWGRPGLFLAALGAVLALAAANAAGAPAPAYVSHAVEHVGTQAKPLVIIGAKSAAGVVANGHAHSNAEPLWSTPALADHQGGGVGSTGLDAVSCPTVSLCFAFGADGRIFTSAAPGDGLPWKLVGHPKDIQEPSDMVCPTVSFCVAIDGGSVVSSASPASSAGSWRVAALAPSNLVDGLSCPAVSLCVVGGFGRIFTSTNPDGGRSAWRSASVDRYSDINSVSCPSVSLCVAVDDAGHALTSTDPTGGVAAWHTARVAANFGLDAVACPSPTLCLALGQDDSQSHNEVFATTDPTSSTPSWSAVPLTQIPATQMVGGFPNALMSSSLTCPSVSVCVAIDSLGRIVTSTNPTGGSGDWQIDPVHDVDAVNAVSCATPANCVAVDNAGNVLSTGIPATRVSAPLVHTVGGGALMRRGHQLLLNTGVGITCPAGGAACTVEGTLTLPGTACGSGPRQVGRISLSVRPGSYRRLTGAIHDHVSEAALVTYGDIDLALIARKAATAVAADVAITPLRSRRAIRREPRRGRSDLPQTAVRACG